MSKVSVRGSWDTAGLLVAVGSTAVALSDDSKLVTACEHPTSPIPARQTAAAPKFPTTRTMLAAVGSVNGRCRRPRQLSTRAARKLRYRACPTKAWLMDRGHLEYQLRVIEIQYRAQQGRGELGRFRELACEMLDGMREEAVGDHQLLAEIGRVRDDVSGRTP